jgi:hypothetical protein
LALVILVLHPSAQAPQLRDAVVLKSIPAPDALRGLTFAQGHLWSIDSKNNQLLQIDPADGHVASTHPLQVKKAGGLSWDGGSFWFIGGDGRALNQTDASGGKALRHFDFWPESSARGYGDPPSSSDSPLNWRALAWDGKYLWAASEREAMVSVVARIDLSDGHTVGSVLASGIPLGLASDGKWLWMATYDHGRRPAVLLRWRIPDAGETDRRSNQAMRESGAIVAYLPCKQPAALAWDGEALWCADREQKTIVRLQLP